MALEIWKGEEKMFTSQVEMNRMLRLSVCHEIYQVIGISRFLLTAVAQSNLFCCNNWWTVFMLSALVSVVTCAGVVQKLSSIWSCKQILATNNIAHKRVIEGGCM